MTPEEAYGAVAGEMYYPDEEGYIEPTDVIADLDEKVVADARQYASENHLPWPPLPSGGLMILIF